MTIKDCDRVSRWLQQNGFNVATYHSEMDNEQRIDLENKLIKNEVKALVATVALGMGFDKPDLGFVVHFQRPGSVVAYYQQIGRAGRALDDAIVVLMSGCEDDAIQEYFINSAFPTIEDTQTVADVLAASDGLSINGLMSRTNLGKSHLERILKLMEIDGLVAKNNSQYQRTVRPLGKNTLYYEEVTRKRRQELSRMQGLVQHKGCLMEYIGRELNDPYAAPCGRCSNCTAPFLPTSADPQILQRAVSFLKRDYQTIEPRKQWPQGGTAGKRGRISEERRLEMGLALCVYGDPGWGRLVQQGKYRDGRFSDELVQSMVEMIRSRLRPQPFPCWVTAVPSKRHPDLVPDFAKRVATSLGLPFVAVLIKIQDSPVQKSMNNSYQQATNALGSIGLSGKIPPGPVLLIDDIVDSRWTMTVCGELLKQAGSGPVFPIALATAGGGVVD